MATTTTRQELDESTGRPTRLDSAMGVVSDAADGVKGVATTAASRLPEVAATTRAAFDDANRRIQAGSDETLTVGTAVSFGFAAGLLIGGASRILVAAALVPVAVMGLTLLDRSSVGRAEPGGQKGARGL